MAKQNRKKITKVVAVLGLILAVIIIACTIYLSDYYHADTERIEAFTVENVVKMNTDEENRITFEPEGATTGFIFYPGGKVEHTAYIPLMQELASNGVLCVLVEMPFHLAVLDSDAAKGIQEQYPEIKVWYIGGHSLGGSMAASYLSGCEEEFQGLVLLGAYSTADLSDTDLSLLSIYGSEDKVMNKEKYDKYTTNLPADFTEIILDGGCHAYFGMYGPQKGDGTPKISNEGQIRMTVEKMMEFMND